VSRGSKGKSFRRKTEQEIERATAFGFFLGFGFGAFALLIDTTT
jgi:hypothetical protein